VAALRGTRGRALSYDLRIILLENWFPLFRIMR
jgi:hypothetical protein